MLQQYRQYMFNDLNTFEIDQTDDSAVILTWELLAKASF